jgi:hypothetical protein
MSLSLQSLCPESVRAESFKTSITLSFDLSEKRWPDKLEQNGNSSKRVVSIHSQVHTMLSRLLYNLKRPIFLNLRILLPVQDRDDVPSSRCLMLF